MQTSQKGLDLIKQFEGLRLRAYKCPAGVWTIGYGHTSMAGPPKVYENMRVTQVEAEYILKKDLLKFEIGVIDVVRVDLTQHQFDALVSFAFNCGVGALQKSGLLRRVNARQFDKVPAEFMKWTKAGGRELPGLVRRRRAEAALWRSVDEQAPVEEDARTTPEAPQPSKTITQSTEANAATVAGLGGAAAAVSELKPIVSDASDAYSAVSAAIGTPAVLIGIGIALLAAYIWWRRKKRLEETGE